MVIKESIQFNGKEISLETGRMAKQANGAVLASYGDTKVLVTAVIQESKEELDYFPLRVDYEERFYASGKIPGGFFKREGRPSDVAILSARMIDRPIRPLFPKGYNDEVQIVATVLSAEPDCSPSIVGMLGASAALMISDAPFQGPIAGVKIGRVDGRLVVNPDAVSQEEGGVEITVAGTKHTVTMVEGKMNELSEEEIIESIDLAHQAIQELIGLQERFVARVNPVKKEVPPVEEDQALRARVRELVWNDFSRLSQLPGKRARHDLVEELKERAVAAIVSPDLSKEEADALTKQVTALVDDLHREYLRTSILTTGLRVDGRRPDELREITCEVGILPRTHGSALFTRGETQSLGIVTLGATRSDEQIIDQMMKEGRKRFMLHYNFPPYSVGEVRRIGSPSRRSIGHGYLAEGAITAVLPPEEEFPYIIRIVSEILESNGSSSMATVCSASLSLMDAGVPIRKPVAGIAMGMIEDEASGKRVILTDILGDEDHCGDMDFKVAGTRDGVTAFQLDVKVGGINREIMREALARAREARLKILDVMTQTLPAPRDHLSPYAPMLDTIQIPVEKIGLVIGPGGKMIRQIIEETGAEIDIEDDGTVRLAGTDPEAVRAAKERIKALTAELEVGTIFKTTVTRTVDFGAFVEMPNGSEGLVHVSNLASGFVDNVRDIVKPGDEITVEVIGEDKMGRPDLRRLEKEGERSQPRGEEHRGRRDSSHRGRGKNNHREEKPAANIKVGDIIEGTVENITDYGAFVELAPGITGLVHISALSDAYVRRVEDVVKPGDKITVEVLDIDERGRYKLRRIAPESENHKEQQIPERKPEHTHKSERAPEREKPHQSHSFEDRW